MALRQAIDLDLVVAVFLNGQLLLTVEKVDDLAAVNLEETHVELHAGGNEPVHVLDSLLCHGRYRVGLAGASLAVREKSYDAFLEERGQQISDLVLVERNSFFSLRVCIVEVEVAILDVLGDSIHLELGVVDADVRI